MKKPRRMLFGKEMVKAITEKRKTQTRRPSLNGNLEAGDLIRVIHNRFEKNNKKQFLVKVTSLHKEPLHFMVKDKKAPQKEGFSDLIAFQDYWHTLYKGNLLYLWEMNPEVYVIDFEFLGTEQEYDNAQKYQQTRR